MAGPGQTHGKQRSLHIRNAQRPHRLSCVTLCSWSKYHFSWFSMLPLALTSLSCRCKNELLCHTRCSFSTASCRLRKEGRARWWMVSTWPSSCRERTPRPSGCSLRCGSTTPTKGRTTATSICSPRHSPSSEWRRAQLSDSVELNAFKTTERTQWYIWYSSPVFRVEVRHCHLLVMIKYCLYHMEKHQKCFSCLIIIIVSQ